MQHSGFCMSGVSCDFRTPCGILSLPFFIWTYMAVRPFFDPGLPFRIGKVLLLCFAQLFSKRYCNIVNYWNILKDLSESHPLWMHSDTYHVYHQLWMPLRHICTFSQRKMVTVGLYENNGLCLPSCLFQGIWGNWKKNVLENMFH